MVMAYGTPTFVDNVTLGTGYYDHATGEYGIEINGVQQADLQSILGLALHEMAHEYFGPDSESEAEYYQFACFGDYLHHAPSPLNTRFTPDPMLFARIDGEEDS